MRGGSNARQQEGFAVVEDCLPSIFLLNFVAAQVSVLVGGNVDGAPGRPKRDS